MEEKKEIILEESKEHTEEEKKAHRKTELLRSLKYLLFTSSAGLVQIGSYALLFEVFHFHEWTSYIIALVLSVLWNFTFNRRFTFKSANNVPVAMFKVTCYYMVFAPLTYFLEKYLVKSCGWNGYLVTFLNMTLNLATEFPFQRFYVFRDSIDTNDLAKKEKTKIEAKESN